MVGALGPVVNGVAQRNFAVAAMHTLDLLLGSTVLALSLSLVGRALTEVEARIVSESAIAGSLALVGMQIAGVTPPQSSWQVPERWRRMMDLDLLAFAYGLLLGLGVFTAVVVAAFWVLISLTLVLDPVVAVAVWGTYALTRGLGFGWLAAQGYGERPLRSHERRLLVLLAALVSAGVALAYLLERSS